MSRLVPNGRWGTLGRALAAVVVVVACAAATTTVAGLLQVHTLVGYLDASKPIKSAGVTLPKPGAPQTLLLIGADKRLGQNQTNIGNTDTMMLVRINDASSTINLLSIPRDLQVNLPGVGEAKLNAAYADGGPSELVDTIKQQVFPGFQVNHIMVVSFLGFAHLISDLGCTWVPVDQRYYNHNDLLGDATNFSNIDIQPGYQKLCGQDGGASSALAFVRFRHFDTDEVRNARQQDFLRWVKDQFSTSFLINNYAKLAKTFGKNVQTDNYLHSTDGLLNLFDAVVNADGHQVKTVQFPETFDNTADGDYVLPTSSAAEAQAYQEFMTPTHAVSSAKAKRKTKTKAKNAHGHKSAARKQRFVIPNGLVADPGDGITQAKELGNVGMPVYYPQYIPSQYGYCFSITTNCDEGIEPQSAYSNSYPRRYSLKIGGRRYKAWVMTLMLDAADPDAGLASGDYVNVQGLQWGNPPLLKQAHTTKVVNGKRLKIYEQGGVVSTVAWDTRHGVYWIQNTLQNTIPNSQMIAMAASLTLAP